MSNLRIKELREDQLQRMNQDYVADYLKVKRSTYSNWENNDTMIPLNKLDEITILFNTSLSYVLGIDNKKSKNEKIRPMNYKLLIRNLENERRNKHFSHQDIGNKLGFSKSKSYRIFNNVIMIKIDDLISLIELFEVDVDKISGKV